jgi:GT2 family glycosyltransferase
MSLPKVYISVLNWNGSEQTIRCLQSLEHLDYPNYQVIVVDNDSHDDSVERIRTAFPEVQLVRADTNRGYAGGNELALKETLADSQAELFWILNNDTVVRPDTLKMLVQAYQRHGEALFGSVPLNNVEHENDEWYTDLHYWEIDENQHYVYRKIKNARFDMLFASVDDRIVANLSGFSLLIPLSVVRKFGFIDTSFFMYMEDADYCFRLRQSGIKSILVPTSLLFHTSGGSRSDQSSVKPIILYYQVRNRLIFWRRYFGLYRYLMLLFKQVFYVIAWVGWYLVGNAQGLRSAYYTLLGIRDALLNRTGKVFTPEQGLVKN